MAPPLLGVLARSPKAFMLMLQRFPKVRRWMREYQAAAGRAAQGGKTRGFSRKAFGANKMGQMSGKARGFGRDYGKAVGEGWNKLPPKTRSRVSRGARYGGAGLGGAQLATMGRESPEQVEERIGRDLLAELDRMGMLKRGELGAAIREAPAGLPPPPPRGTDPDVDYWDPWRRS